MLTEMLIAKTGDHLVDLISRACFNSKSEAKRHIGINNVSIGDEGVTDIDHKINLNDSGKWVKVGNRTFKLIVLWEEPT